MTSQNQMFSILTPFINRILIVTAILALGDMDYFQESICIYSWHVNRHTLAWNLVQLKQPDNNTRNDFHDDVIKWKYFPRYWPCVPEINRSPVNSPHKGQWRGALMFSLFRASINGWVNNREAGDLRRAHYDVTVMDSRNTSAPMPIFIIFIREYRAQIACWLCHKITHQRHVAKLNLVTLTIFPFSE